MNSFPVQYNKRRSVERKFDEALRNEEKIEKEIKEAKIALENLESRMKAAITKRKKIQEAMRASLLSAAHGLRDPGRVLTVNFLNIKFLREARRQSH